jgi:cellulose synthase/poly-beta-1,6-N-acetylglucosamine synthase-like glycosyltransferase
VFWFIYLLFTFIISFASTAEAFLSFQAASKSRRTLQNVVDLGYKFQTPDLNLPTIDIIIVAYLPNEKDIIINQALYALECLEYPLEKITINIVYNTPYPIEPLETNLRVLASKHKQCRVIKVPNSKSKAENINYMLSQGAAGEIFKAADITAIYDCDHFPHPYAPRWAAERFLAEPAVDIVQGRCVVYNARTNTITRLVAVEFDRIYAVGHPGRENMYDFGLFCGSNGYWKTSILQRIGMDHNMMTEDIDSALRAFEIGSRAVHDMNVISYEQAPDSLSTLYKQRLRWAQGWTQVSFRHIGLIWKKPPSNSINNTRTLAPRIGLVMLLIVREFSYFLNSQYLCLMLGFVISRFPKSAGGLADLVFFQYPVSKWLFLTR